jgi:hypothetical protein
VAAVSLTRPQVTYVPALSGKYQIFVAIKNFTIPGSPFVMMCSPRAPTVPPAAAVSDVHGHSATGTRAVCGAG